MKKKIISTILVLIGLFVTGSSVLYFLGLFQQQDSGILVESEPVATVSINGKEVGSTPYEANINAGEISLKIKPNVDDGIILDDYETKINLIPGVKTIVKRSFKPNEESSSGATVSFETVGGQDSFVTVVSIPDGAQISIDNKNYGYAPLRTRTAAGDHDLVISFDGYAEKKLPIKVYKGFNLTASVKLSKLEEDVASVEKSSSGVSEKIRINKNDVGFLRVRSGASVGFPEVGQVKPDEEYNVIEIGENGKWFKIKLPNVEGLPLDREGWVSSEFVTKI